MKMGFWRLAAVAFLLFVLAACSTMEIYEPAQIDEYIVAYDESYVETQEEVTQEDDYEDYYEAEVAQEEIPPPDHYFDIFTSGRTRGEYLEDLDHLYSTLAANYPFFGVIYRTRGVDMHELYRETRRHIETIRDIPSDQYFANLIDGRFISHAQHAGHFNMLTGDFLQLHIQVFTNQVVTLGSRQFLYFLEELDNPATRALHGLTDDNFAPPPPGVDSFVYATTSDNIEARIIEAGRIAYVNILQMNHATMNLDRDKLLDFYRHVADFDHLIIDIRQNPGGDSRFFQNLVIAPNISEPLHYHFYMFLMEGDHNMRLLAPWFENWWDGTTPYPVFAPIHDDLLVGLPYLNPDDFTALDLYWRWDAVIYPSQDEAIFGGKIWLLVSGTNFSASEQAAATAKQTGFATLVGQTTGGDGIGINPLMLALPNSGVVVRYSSIYGTDHQGRNNQEFGTDPHFFNRPRRDALQTTLELIAEDNY
ncbi:MAG: S41 family peptidase [Defluviitaleaceae bacterium]|nr:S41 family peptidase [Defluviitaleaceae bacterium]